jgi:putative membrane protein
MRSRLHNKEEYLKPQKTLSLFTGRLVKGFIIGASMLIPGVSGGTMAIILGIYDELIAAVSHLSKQWKANGLLLLQCILGGAAGVLLLSGPLLTALELWTRPVLFFFMGAILAGIPPIFQKVRVTRIKLRNILVALLGAAIAIATEYLPSDLYTPGDEFSLVNSLLLLIAGFIIAVALILPGISGSYVLLMLGMYDLTLAALHDMNLAYLIPLLTGALVGVFSTARFLDNQMQRHPQFTYMLIIGFMLGSLAQVFPGIPEGAEILLCPGMLLAGFGIVFGSGKFLQKRSDSA